MNLIAACAFGLEAIVKRELIALGFEPQVTQPGRILFSGDESDICRANLWLRTADRVLIEVLRFPAPDFDALFETVKDFDWSQFLPCDAEFPVMGKSRKSQLTSVPAIQRSVKKAIVESLKRAHQTQTLDETGPRYRIEAALLDDQASITIDTSGPSLHKRGYRKLAAEAPLKETLAAAMIDLSVWNPDRPLIDPFCGSGTIPIEAAMIAKNIAPGLQRTFAAIDWPFIGEQRWSDIRQQAQDSIQNDLDLQIMGTDRDADVLSLARYHVRQAGVADDIHFQQKLFSDLRSKREYGCIITNPPYGERLETQKRLEELYLSIPAVMQRLPTWSLFLITNMPRFEKLIQKKATRRRKLYNGRLECTYYQFLGPKPSNTSAPPPPSTPATPPPSTPPPLHSTSPTQSPIFTGLQPKDHEQAQLFQNRLAKRARHLRRWPTRQGITCFRLYEKDVPEIPLVVDRYEDHLHITEYERPHDRDLARHAAWLELMQKTAASTLDVPIQRTHLKRRSKNAESGQYDKLADAGNLIPVQENGLTFLVNLTDYVDTGLFLDHRNTRRMVAEEARDKDFLNLFAYTGSFTVYAADAGAASTTTVDLSKNYLQWARKNMEANRLTGPQHGFVAADTLQFLEKTKQKPSQRFDLIVADPPTFSNSKRTEQDWDVQRDHARLLNELQHVLRPQAVIYFSTNFRRFKLSENELADFEIMEISRQTVPEDFRNKRIHRCWRMVYKGNS